VETSTPGWAIFETMLLCFVVPAVLGLRRLRAALIG
jgi:hypothetical protein